MVSLEQVRRAQTFMDLADEKLEVARELLGLSRYDDVVSKAYYTMFYAAKALLLLKGIDARRHTGVTSHFGQEFVKSGRVDRRYSRLLRKAMEDRGVADYDPEVRATRREAEEAIANAEEFLLKAKELFAEILGQTGTSP